MASLIALTALAVAPSVSAHAVLRGSTPGNGSVVAQTPPRVVLRFSEPVEVAFGAVRVFDDRVRRVESGRTVRLAAEQVAVGLPDDLPGGTYTVAWRVVSADSHPVHGAFVFHVGAPSGSGAGVVSEVLDAYAGSQTVDVAFAVVRAASLALILLLVGGSLMLAGLLPQQGVFRGPLWVVLSAYGGLLTVVSLAGIGLQGSAAAGLGLVDGFRGSLYGEVLDTQFGRIWLARAVIATLIAAVALVIRLRFAGRERKGALAVLASSLLLVPTPGLAGHAWVEGWYAVASDAVHVAAGSVWAGGLCFLAFALLWADGARWPLATRVVPAFSSAAVLAMAALVVTGAVNGFLEVRSWSALWGTRYGVILLVKVGLVALLIGVGAFNNRVSVPRLRTGEASLVDRRRFLVAVGAELAFFVAVVGVTAALVAEPPAKVAAQAAAGPVTEQGRIGPFDVTLVVDPARTGRNEVHVYLLDRFTGQPVEVDEVSIAATYPAADIGPLALKPLRAGPGHVVVPAATLPFAGTWQLQVAARKGEFDQWSTSFTTPITKDT